MYGRSELIFYFILIFWTVYCIFFFSLFFYILYNIFFFRFLNKMFNPGKVWNILAIIYIFDQDKLLNGEIHLPSQAK